jgi:hypothetical protein
VILPISTSTSTKKPGLCITMALKYILLIYMFFFNKIREILCSVFKLKILVIVFFWFLFFCGDKVYTPSWLQTPPASPSWVLGLEAYITMPLL